jgi:hypothetical protein
MVWRANVQSFVPFGASRSMVIVVSDPPTSVTHAAASAVRSAELVLAIESDTLGEELLGLREYDPGGRRPVWLAVAALAGDPDDHRRLVVALADIEEDDAYPVAIALAALSAARHCDRELAGWCRDRLVRFGDQTAMLGFGTMVLGYAAMFRGVAAWIAGDEVGARTDLAKAVERSRRVGAWLWWAHAQLWLADVLREGGDREGARVAVRPCPTPDLGARHVAVRPVIVVRSEARRRSRRCRCRP